MSFRGVPLQITTSLFIYAVHMPCYFERYPALKYVLNTSNTLLRYGMNYMDIFKLVNLFLFQNIDNT